MTHDVSQGSVLGPLLFILYTNDLPNSIKHSKTILFADDTTIYATGNNSADLFEKVNEDLSHLTDWFRANQLSVNASKTKYMLISSKNNTTKSTATLKIDAATPKIDSTIMNATYNEHNSPLFKATNILKLTDLHDLQAIKFMDKFMHKELPLSLLELLQSQVVNHEHATRHRDGPNLPLAHSEVTRRSIFHRGPNLWMNLPNHLRTTATTNALVNNWRKDNISQY